MPNLRFASQLRVGKPQRPTLNFCEWQYASSAFLVRCQHPRIALFSLQTRALQALTPRRGRVDFLAESRELRRSI